MCRKMKLGYLLTPYTRMNSKWIKDFNVRPKTVKILEENIDSTISDNARSNFLSDVSPQEREAKERNKQMGLFYHIKNLCRVAKGEWGRAGGR